LFEAILGSTQSQSNLQPILISQNNITLPTEPTMMHSKILTLITCFAPAALADFFAYCGQYCVNDGAGCPVSCTFYNKAPESCDEINNSVNHIQSMDNDASGPCGGLACDGCDPAINARDWKISRLEINNSQGCTPS
jgi:hypothetical protein